MLIGLRPYIKLIGLRSYIKKDPTTANISNQSSAISHQFPLYLLLYSNIWSTKVVL